MSQPSWIGKTIGGRYQIVELLGQGGMSAVYKANDPNLRRVVAVKLIHSHLSSDPKFVMRFEEEAAAVAQLRHPNIIQVYDFSNDDDTYYIVFEFVPGESLQQRLERLNDAGRSMPVDEAIKITASIADALDYAHERGLIHRDIKPANVMLNVLGEAILMDFGIVKIVGGDTHTATGAVMGTARYMSPEQIKGQRVDARTDIYALGTALFEMLGGRPPFEADSAMTLMMMHVNDPVPDVRQLRPEVPVQVVSVINKALAKDRDARFATAGQMAAALRGDSSAGAAAAAAAVAAGTVIEDAPPDEAGQGATVLEPVPPAPAPPTPQTEGATVLEPAIAAQAVATPPEAQAPVQSDEGGSRRTLIIGGIAIAVLLLICIVAAAVVFGSTLLGGGGEEETPLAAAIETQEALAATQTAEAEIESPAATETSEPTATDEIEPTPTAEATATDAVLPTDTPAATATTAPTDTPLPTATPTEPAGPFVGINSIGISGDSYVVDYYTTGYTPALPGTHIHFFWDTVPPENAGVGPTQGSWFVYGGPNPFTGYKLGDRPGAAMAMCSLVANPDHTIILNTGNCVPLP
jgi:serine/threonine-protein kinase